MTTQTWRTHNSEMWMQIDQTRSNTRVSEVIHSHVCCTVTLLPNTVQEAWRYIPNCYNRPSIQKNVAINNLNSIPGSTGSPYYHAIGGVPGTKRSLSLSLRSRSTGIRNSRCAYALHVARSSAQWWWLVIRVHPSGPQHGPPVSVSWTVKSLKLSTTTTQHMKPRSHRNRKTPLAQGYLWPLWYLPGPQFNRFRPDTFQDPQSNRFRQVQTTQPVPFKCTLILIIWCSYSWASPEWQMVGTESHALAGSRTKESTTGNH